MGILEIATQGFLLRSVPYLGKKRILTIFSSERGLFSLVGSGGRLNSLMTPFLIAEWIYREGRGGLGTLVDGTLVDPLPSLKNSYGALMAVGKMSADLLLSQKEGGRDSHKLYQLAVAYAKKLDQGASFFLVESFRLKLLMHEGLLSLQDECSVCKEQATTLCGGESVCSRHASSDGMVFLPQEWETMKILCRTRSFSSLGRLEVSPALSEKIAILFSSQF